jgi:hypothetical protein
MKRIFVDFVLPIVGLVLVSATSGFALEAKRVNVFTLKRWPARGPFIESGQQIIAAANEKVADELNRLDFTKGQYTCTAKYSLTRANLGTIHTIASVFELGDCVPK